MRILIAPDSFKESLSAKEVADVYKRQMRSILSVCQMVILSLVFILPMCPTMSLKVRLLTVRP